MADDRGFTPAFEALPGFKPVAGDLPLVLNADFGAFQLALQEHRLTGGVFYKVKGVPDVVTANRLMEKVRAYRV
jgi:hypothetical protein